MDNKKSISNQCFECCDYTENTHFLLLEYEPSISHRFYTTVDSLIQFIKLISRSYELTSFEFSDILILVCSLIFLNGFTTCVGKCESYFSTIYNHNKSKLFILISYELVQIFFIVDS